MLLLFRLTLGLPQATVEATLAINDSAPTVELSDSAVELTLSDNSG